MSNLVKNFFKKSKIYFNTNILFLIFVISSVINGVILRSFTVGNTFDVKPIIADLAVVLFIAAIGYLLKPRHQFKYFVIFSLFLSIICVVNSVYYTNFISFASVSLIQTSTQLPDVADAVYKNLLQFKDLIFLWQVFALVFVNINLKKRGYFTKVEEVEDGKFRALNTLVVGLIAIGFFLSTLTGIDISRLGKQWNREFIVMRYGIYTYHGNDIFSYARSKLNNMFGFDEAYKTFREFYDSKEVDLSTNKYTNIYEGKNIISIHAESMPFFAIDMKINGKEITPNLNKLYKEGLGFTNFYAQEAVGTSSDSEFTINSSLLPVSSGTVAINYWDRNYVTTPKMLKEKGYYAFSMHGNNGDFWNRNSLHKSLGYDYYYSHKKDYVIDEEIGLGLSDKSFFRQSAEYIEEIHEAEQNFYGTLLMLTNHTPWTDILDKEIVEFDLTMPYTEIDPETGEEVEKIAPYLVGTKMEGYLKSVHYADEAIGQLIADLDERGILEDTVIVLYGDHDAKLKRSDYNQLYNYNPVEDEILDKEDPDYIDFDFYKRELTRSVPLVIWSKDKPIKKQIDMVAGMYDVQPTLGNLFGFDNKYSLGVDLLSAETNMVVFPSGNWLTNKMYYNSQKREGKLLDPNYFVSVEEIESLSQKSEKLLEVSESIIIFDMIQRQEERTVLFEDGDIINEETN